MTHQFSACASSKERAQCFSSSCTTDFLKLAWQKKTFAVSISTTTQTHVCTIASAITAEQEGPFTHIRETKNKKHLAAARTDLATLYRRPPLRRFLSRDLALPIFFFSLHLRRAQMFTKPAMSDAGQTERCGGSTGLVLSSVTRNLKKTGHVCPPNPGPSRRGSEGCSGSSCCWKRSSGGDLAAAVAALLSSRREWSPAA